MIASARQQEIARVVETIEALGGATGPNQMLVEVWREYLRLRRIYETRLKC